MDGAPVGRAAEWRLFVEWLADHGSGLLVIHGEPGSGRTHLMRCFGAHAQAQGYAAAGCDEQLPIEKTTRINDISRALTAVLGTDAPASRDEQGFLSSLISAFKTGLTEEQDLLTIFDGRRLFVGIDGYSPSVSLERWLLGSLVSWIKNADRKIVLVVVDRQERVERARTKADVVFALGPLDGEELRRHFTSVSASLDPQLSSHEIECYAEAASEDPSVLEALNTVLLTTVSRGN